MIFVRHGLPLVDRSAPRHDWPLDPSGSAAIESLATRLPALPVVTSDLRRAIDTGRHFGDPIIDARLGEVARPWSDDFDDAVARFLAGEAIAGWEPQSEARARFKAALDEHGDAIYVTHGTVLTLFLMAVVPGFDAIAFWTSMAFPDAWLLDTEGLSRLT